jgi:hypothetical protein
MATKASNIAQAARTVDASGNVDGDTLDSLDSSQFLRSDTSDTMVGKLNIQRTGTLGPDGSFTYVNAYIHLEDTDGSDNLYIDPNQIVATADFNLHTIGGNINFFPVSGSQVVVQRGGLHISSGDVKVADGDLWVLDGTDDGLRIKPGVGGASLYGASTLNNAIVFTNEQGSVNQAFILNDSAASTDPLFFVSTTTLGSEPNTGSETWVKKLNLTNDGTLEVVGKLLAESQVGIKITSPVAALDVAGDNTTESAPSVFSYDYATNGGGVRIHGGESALDIISSADGNHASSVLLRGGNSGYGFINNPDLSKLELKYFTASDNNFRIHASGTQVSELTTLLTVSNSGLVEAGNINVTDRLQIPSGTQVERPANGDAGALYFNTTNSSLDISNGSDWLSVSFSNYRGYFEDVNVQSASGAYSLRRLTRNYSGPCMQITDGTINQDVYFTEDGDLDVDAIDFFIASTGSPVAGVRIWYDQSGGGKHASQTFGSYRPRIYQDGAVVRAANGKPAIWFDGSADYFEIADQIVGGADQGLLFVGSVHANKEHYIYSGGYNGGEPDTLYYFNSAGFSSNDSEPTLSVSDAIFPTYPMSFISQTLNGTTTRNMYAGSGANVATSTNVSLGAIQETKGHHIGYAIPRNKTSAFYGGHMQELIYWGEYGLNSQVQTTFDNVNAYWGINNALIPSDPNKATSEYNAATNEVIHTITASTNTEIIGAVNATRILMLAGGGGGGCGNTASSLAGGGGGAGGLIYQTNYGISAGTKQVVIGAGGAGAIGPNTDSGGGNTGFPAATGSNGGNTTFNGLSAIGGGGGGTRNAYEDGKPGGSGGGHAGTSIGPGGDGTPGQGNDGSSNLGSSSAWHAGGGGGAGAAAADYSGTEWFCGDGGAGSTYDISGSSVTYAGGGGGGDHYNTSTGVGSVPGDGGAGGGGDGALHPSQQYAGSGTDGLGGGGGGAMAHNSSSFSTQYAGDGGDGILIIRHIVG